MHRYFDIRVVKFLVKAYFVDYVLALVVCLFIIVVFILSHSFYLVKFVILLLPDSGE